MLILNFNMYLPGLLLPKKNCGVVLSGLGTALVELARCVKSVKVIAATNGYHRKPGIITVTTPAGIFVKYVNIHIFPCRLVQ